MPSFPFRIAVLISGGGTTLQNIYRCIERGELEVEVGLVISSSAKATGLEFARQQGTPYKVAPKTRNLSAGQYSDEIFGPIRDGKIDLVVMGGFLKHVLIPEDFTNRVINIHPSLIPEFSGEGFYGMHVHRAVIQAQRNETGCTVHFVDNEYDHGPIIDQVKVPVFPEDTPESLQKRVFEAECLAYPKVIQAIAKKRA